MSTYFKMWNSTITADEPSSYTPVPPVAVGFLGSGKPIVQGWERGILSWDAMTLAAWIDMWDRYNTNKNSSGTFVIPGRTSGQSWTTWRSVTAWVVEQPKSEYRDKLVYNVTLEILITA